MINILKLFFFFFFYAFYNVGGKKSQKAQTGTGWWKKPDQFDSASSSSWWQPVKIWTVWVDLNKHYLITLKKNKLNLNLLHIQIWTPDPLNSTKLIQIFPSLQRGPRVPPCLLELRDNITGGSSGRGAPNLYYQPEASGSGRKRQRRLQYGEFSFTWPHSLTSGLCVSCSRRAWK